MIYVCVYIEEVNNITNFLFFQEEDIRMYRTLPLLNEMFPNHGEVCERSDLHDSNFDLSQAVGIILGQGLHGL